MSYSPSYFNPEETNISLETSLTEEFKCFLDKSAWADPRDLNSAQASEAQQAYKGVYLLAGEHFINASYQKAADYFDEAAKIRQAFIVIVHQLPEIREQHQNAIKMCCHFKEYCLALRRWQDGPNKPDNNYCPRPRAYGITRKMIEKFTLLIQQQLEQAACFAPRFPGPGR